MSESDDESTIDINLRPVDEVGDRILILSALIRMAILETDEELDPDEAAAEIVDLTEALLVGPWSERVTSAERAYLQVPVGQHDEIDLIAMLWRNEALAALAWAVSELPGLPAAWEQVNLGEVVDRFPAPWDDVESFLKGLSLRSDETIAEERERAELWSWRAAIEEDFQTARGRERSELQATLRETVEEAVHLGLLQRGRDDFLVGNRPFSSVDPETQAQITEIAFQRLWALNWLSGFGDSWDTVPLEI